MPSKSSRTSQNLSFVVQDRRKRGYFTIDNVLIDDYGKQLGAYGLAVYMALARFANQESRCWPSFETIAQRTNISRRQVMREIAKLIELRLILCTPQIDPDKGEHKSNLYTLLDIVGGGDSLAPRQSLKKSYVYQRYTKKAFDDHADIIQEAARNPNNP